MERTIIAAAMICIPGMTALADTSHKLPAATCSELVAEYAANLRSFEKSKSYGGPEYQGVRDQLRQSMLRLLTIANSGGCDGQKFVDAELHLR